MNGEQSNNSQSDEIVLSPGLGSPQKPLLSLLLPHQGIQQIPELPIRGCGWID
jgi:hypothetical protein